MYLWANFWSKLLVNLRIKPTIFMHDRHSKYCQQWRWFSSIKQFCESLCEVLLRKNTELLIFVLLSKEIRSRSDVRTVNLQSCSSSTWIFKLSGSSPKYFCFKNFSFLLASGLSITTKSQMNSLQKMHEYFWLLQLPLLNSNENFF